jgi:CRISPR-associated protein Cas1
MREGKPRSAARRREHSGGQQDSKELSEVIKRAFEASEEPVPHVESPLSALETDKPLTAEPLSNPTEGVQEPPTEQADPDQLSGRSKDQTAPETSGPAMPEAPLKTELQAPAAQHSPQSEIRDPAEPLPARMLNEFVYCPRLFYYEHVEGIFVDNADTVRGAAVHARVDKGTGALPAAQSETANAKTDESEDDAEGEGSKPKTENEKIHSRQAHRAKATSNTDPAREWISL